MHDFNQLIPQAFGSVDFKYAHHHLDRIGAAHLLAAALSDNVTYESYLQNIEDWLAANGCSRAHIQDEMSRVDRHSKAFFV